MPFCTDTHIAKIDQRREWVRFIFLVKSVLRFRAGSDAARPTGTGCATTSAGRALVCRSRRGSLLGAEAARNRGKSITVTEAGVPASGDFKIAAVGAGAIDIPFVTSSTVGGKG